MSTSVTVEVAAPATLQEGSTFQAQVDGKEFTVIVPTGGVEKDEVFSVPYPAEMENDKTPSLGKEEEVILSKALLVPTCEAAVVSTYQTDSFNHVPTGQWRTDLCDWMCMMGIFCPTILMSQVMERMNIDICGQQALTGDPKSVCRVFTLFILCVVPLLSIIAVLLQDESMSSAINIIVYGWSIYLIVVFTKTRMYMRRKYNIRPACTDCCIEDCLIVHFCACCSAIQLASHTHNRMEYKNRYKMSSPTGLFSDASGVV